jgi:hypothetical protein
MNSVGAKSLLRLTIRSSPCQDMIEVSRSFLHDHNHSVHSRRRPANPFVGSPTLSQKLQGWLE